MVALDYFMAKAIACCDGSQKKLSRLMGDKPEKVSYLLNRAKKISLEDALKIEAATNGVVTRYHLASHLNIKVKRLFEEKAKTINELRISERVGVGMAHEKEIGSRKGGRSDLSRENFPKVNGRTEALAATYAGFRNYKTYHHAKVATLYGTPELIAAMDDQVIGVSTAAKIARLSEAEQLRILQLSKKEIIAQVKLSDQKNAPRFTTLSKEYLEVFLLSFLRIYFLLLQTTEGN